MVYAYMTLSAVLIVVIDRFHPIFRNVNGIWIVPLLFIAFMVGFILLHAIIFIGSLILINPDKPVKCERYYKGLAKVTLPVVAWLLRMKIKVSGEELLPCNRRFVIVANHTSILDPVILMAAFPQCEFAFLAKEETRKMPVVPQFIASQGGAFVDRENTRSGAKSLIKMINLLKDDKASVGIFPEGTRSKTGELLPFKPGAVRAAAKAGVPFTVCTIKGAAKVFKRFPLKSTKIKLDILKTFSAEEVTNGDKDTLENTAREIMLESLGQ